MSSNLDDEPELTDVQRLTIGLTLLIWSFALAIIVGISLLITNPYSIGLIGPVGLLLVILPSLGSYLLSKG
ncbi:hypothetical protein EU527_01335 [Candidatus Thorarchaeota archaeon]|nr:MAG: hypothetical protein EU527_01335 [Candidatus Thorarchaeota archaeon]